MRRLLAAEGQRGPHISVTSQPVGDSTIPPVSVDSSDRQQPGLFDDQRAPAPPPPALPGVAVREVTCRGLLNCGSGADYSFNCYRGCTHACIYCYARFMQRFHPHDEPWGRFVDVKINAAEVLAREVRRRPPGSVFTCSACDGWQSVERHYRLTRRCCQILLDAGFRLTILTKSELVLRDLDILRGRDVSVGVTITTADENEAHQWEPGAASVAARLKVLREARAAGLKTTLMFGPLLPEISDDGLGRLFALAADVQPDRIWTDVLNNRPRVWESVQRFLRGHRPVLLERYRQVLFDAGARRRYVEDVHRRIRQAALAVGLADKLA